MNINQKYKLSDWYNARFLEKDYMSALRNKVAERVKNQTYIIGKQDTKTTHQNMFRDEQTGLMFDMFVNKSLQSRDGEQKVEIVSSSSKLPEYNEDLNHIIETFFNLCGYSFNTGEEQAGSDTATGQMLMKGRDIETTLNKRRIRQYA